METNLDLAWKTDKSKETEGTWIEVSDGVEFKIKRFGGRNALNIKEAYAKNKRSGKKNESDEDTARSFVKACITGWKGLTADKKELEFSEENAVKLLVDLPDLADHLFDLARDMDNFKVEMGND